jgi:DNA repair protein RadD
MSDLRPYQIEPFNRSVEFFQKKAPDPAIVVAPTAFGKSHLIAATANNIEGRSLILQPSKELLAQNYEKLIRMGGRASIYSASAGQKRFGNIMYATIGSIKTLGPKFQALGFANLIIDEVHMYPRAVESMLGSFLQSSGITKVLGLTATPFKLQSNTDQNGNRFSKLSMLTSLSKASKTADSHVGRFFKDIIHVTQIQELTDLGFWTRLEYEIHEYCERGLVWNTVKSDYTEESLLFNFEDQDIEQKILYRLRSLDRKAVLIFVPTIEAAVRMASMVPGSAAVHSNMADNDRDQVIKSFKAGRIRYVFNVNILATGFDHTGIDCIIFGRRTASLAWFYQAGGRGTRIQEGKEDCLLIDFAGNIDRFGKLEFIYFKKKKTWQCYGEGGRLLTGIAMHQIGEVFDSPVSGVILPWGKYKGDDISAVPRDYLHWLVTNKDFKWNDQNHYIKEAAEKILEKQTA